MMLLKSDINLVNIKKRLWNIEEKNVPLLTLHKYIINNYCKQTKKISCPFNTWTKKMQTEILNNKHKGLGLNSSPPLPLQANNQRSIKTNKRTNKQPHIYRQIKQPCNYDVDFPPNPFPCPLSLFHSLSYTTREIM